MAVTTGMYQKALKNLATGKVNLLGDFPISIKVALLDSTYVLNNNDEYFSDIFPYTIDGIIDPSLSGRILYPVPNGYVFSADPATWVGVTSSIRYVVIYQENTYDDDNTTWPLIFWVDHGEDIDINDSDFQIVWNTNGIHQFTLEESS